MGTEFKQFIEDEKRERIPNFDILRDRQPFNLNSISTEERDAYFEKNRIDRESIIGLLLSADDNYSFIIEGYFTNIVDQGEDYEKILLEITEKGPFNTPQELIKAIAECIKENMSYDTFEALRQLQSSDGAIGEFSLVLNHPEAGLTMYHLQILEETFGIYRENMSEIPEEHYDMVTELLGFIDSQNLYGFKQYLLGMKVGDKKNFLDLLDVLSIEKRNNELQDLESVTSILRDKKIGVCRHFSMIAKMIFNDMVSRKWQEIQFHGNAEVLYVINAPQNHVYNILMYEGIDGEIQKLYFDITTFLNSGELFPSIETMNDREIDNEIFVEDFDNSLEKQYV